MFGYCVFIFSDNQKEEKLTQNLPLKYFKSTKPEPPDINQRFVLINQHV